MPEYLPSPGRRDLTCKRQQWLDSLPRFLESSSRDAKLHLVERDIQFVGVILLLAEGILCLGIR